METIQELRDKITMLEDALRIATQENKESAVRKQCALWKFTNTEIKIFLALKSDRCVSHDYIRNVIYPVNDWPTSPNNIRVFIATMRRRMKEANAPVRIVTEWGVGYRVAPCD